MNKTILTAMAIIAIVLSFCGCITHKPIVFNESLPKSEAVTIYWAGTQNYVHPVAYNGINVDWNIGSWGFYPIIIPAGEATFELEGYTFARNSVGTAGGELIYSDRWNYSGRSISYNFEKGKSYTIFFEGARISIHNGKNYGDKEVLKIIEYRSLKY